MFSLRPLLPALLLAAMPGTLAAQHPTPPSRILWLAYGGDHAITDRTALLVDVQGRAEAAQGGFRQVLIRPGLAVRVAGPLRAAAGYATQRTAEQYGEASSAGSVEHRTWQMLQVSHAAGPLTLTHRSRLEQRWTLDTPVPVGLPRHWSYANRARYLLRASAAVPGFAHRLQLIASDELFAGVGGGAGAPRLEQNWLTLAAGVRVHSTLRVDVGYLNQATRRESTLRVRRHALYLGMSSTEPFGR